MASAAVGEQQLLRMDSSSWLLPAGLLGRDCLELGGGAVVGVPSVGGGAGVGGSGTGHGVPSCRVEAGFFAGDQRAGSCPALRASAAEAELLASGGDAAEQQQVRHAARLASDAYAALTRREQERRASVELQQQELLEHEHENENDGLVVQPSSIDHFFAAEAPEQPSSLLIGVDVGATTATEQTPAASVPAEPFQLQPADPVTPIKNELNDNVLRLPLTASALDDDFGLNEFLEGDLDSLEEALSGRAFEQSSLFGGALCGDASSWEDELGTAFIYPTLDVSSANGEESQVVEKVEEPKAAQSGTNSVTHSDDANRFNASALREKAAAARERAMAAAAVASAAADRAQAIINVVATAPDAIVSPILLERGAEKSIASSRSKSFAKENGSPRAPKSGSSNGKGLAVAKGVATAGKGENSRESSKLSDHLAKVHERSEGKRKPKAVKRFEAVPAEADAVVRKPQKGQHKRVAEEQPLQQVKQVVKKAKADKPSVAGKGAASVKTHSSAALANSKTISPEGGPPSGCLHCKRLQTPQWRLGPTGPKTLCNACGVRWMKSLRGKAPPLVGL